MKSLNIEAALQNYLSENLSVPVSSDVPNPRPDEFVTYERTGGARSNCVIDQSTVAIQCWAKERPEASILAYLVDEIMQDFVYEKGINKVSRNSFYNNPDLDSGCPRYQIVYDITTSF